MKKPKSLYNMRECIYNQTVLKFSRGVKMKKKTMIIINKENNRIYIYM